MDLRFLVDGSRRVDRSNSHEPRLYEEIPYSTCLVHVDLDKVASFSTTKFSTATCIFAYQCFFDDEIWLGENAEL